MANPFANSVKFLKAISLLTSSKGITIKGLMENLNISRRSVFRLFEALESLGFPLVDEQPFHRAEKTYRLMDCYVLKLPNLDIPDPNFTLREKELLLSILKFYMDIQHPDGVILLNGIRQKVEALPSSERKESKK